MRRDARITATTERRRLVRWLSARRSVLGTLGASSLRFRGLIQSLRGALMGRNVIWMISLVTLGLYSAGM